MLITEMSSQECRDLLARLGSGRLACSRDSQPYIVPVYFAYEPDSLYGFATLGRKIEWMRSNPLVCVETDEVRSHFEWQSVIVLGRYEEFPDTPEYGDSRAQALALLEKRFLWWQTAYGAGQTRRRKGQAAPVFYCVHIEEITGHRASPDPIETAGLTQPRT
jgi:nitroimidazol reductase NimA-like FMN-containing flavoprotein (pyridoxamine 5'-phosphate oxidase superfamily)